MSAEPIECRWGGGVGVALAFDGQAIRCIDKAPPRGFFRKRPEGYEKVLVSFPPSMAWVTRHPSGSYTLFANLGKGDVRQFTRLRARDGVSPPTEFLQALNGIGVRIVEGRDPEGQIKTVAAAPMATGVERGKVNMGRTMGKAVVFLPWAVMRPSRKKDKRIVR
jgi:hypothetical protein